MKPSSAKAKGSRLERKVAALTGGKRAPLSGAIGGGDVWGGSLTPYWSIECKARAKLPSLITSAIAQAQSDISVGDLRKPLVICQQDHGQPIAIMYLQDLLDHLEALQEQPRQSQLKQMLRQIRRIADEAEAYLKE